MIGLSVFVYLFLTVFEPFGIGEIVFYKPLILLGYGFITLIVSVLLFFVVPMVFPKYFDEDQWTVKKSIVFIFWELLFISILNWLYTLSLGHNIIGKEFTLFEFVFFTVAVGTFATIFLILAWERWLNHRNQTRAKQWTTDLSYHPLAKQKAHISIGKENNLLQLSLENLLCIQSDGNYTEVYVIDQGRVIKKLLRCSLSVIDQQLKKYPNVHQCHRSYIVNFDHVISVNGNARNYNLHLDLLDFPIPISRQFPKNILQNFKRLTQGH